MIVSIHQPEHLPWPGFFNKASKSDVFVILDSVDFRKNYFQNRNLISSQKGKEWLTIPVQKETVDKSIRNIKVVTSSNSWKKKYLKTLYYNYHKSPFFNLFFEEIEKIINKNHKKLIKYNMDLIAFFFSVLGINPKLFFSSSMNVNLSKGELVLEILDKVGATTYLSGISGKDYLDLNKFAKRGIKIDFISFQYPVYEQMYDPFQDNLCIVDMLFNIGPDDSRKLILS